MPMNFKRRKTAIIFISVLLALSFAGTASARLTLEPDTLLRLGTYGEEVAALQTELKLLGLFDGYISGLYCEETFDAVLSLQKMLAVHPDGIFGPITYGAYQKAIESGEIKYVSIQPYATILTGKVIGVDACSQRNENTAYEPLAPNIDRTKFKMSAPFSGIRTGVSDYVINLLVAKKVENILIKLGATVIMTRTGHDVDISNRERAVMMNEKPVDFWIRIACGNGHSSGPAVLIPSRAYNPAIYRQSLTLGKCLQNEFAKATGAKDAALSASLTQAGFNWSAVPVATVTLGNLGNSGDDALLSRDSYQNLCAQGIINALIAYCEADHA